MEPRPQIYLASLADYNAGRLHGTWIDATQEVEELAAAADRMLAGSQIVGAEEYAIHDFEGFGPRRLAITERQPDPCRHIVIGHKESIFAAAEFPRESLSGFFESHQVLALARRAAHPKHQPEVPLPQPVRQRPLHRRSAGLVFRQHRPDTGGAKQRRSCFGPQESSSPWTADWRVRRCSRRSRPPTGPAASPVAGES